MTNQISVSLIIPLYNESDTIRNLISSINSQLFKPREVIFVDGGSTDNTCQIIEEIIGEDPGFVLIRAGRAYPGKGRNIGTSKAKCEWIAFTDAGIRLDPLWLDTMVREVNKNPDVSLVYGNFSPEIKNLFDKAATISYVPPMKANFIRTKSIVSCLMRKRIWELAGGFPDWRASEDLIFMENAEKAGAIISFAPAAMAYWQLRPNLASTFRKFDLYSKHNVWAGRQAYWHYGVARQYLFPFLFLVIAIIYHPLFLLGIPTWLFARTTKRMFGFRHEFGPGILFNPILHFLVLIIIITIDIATFSGWVKARLNQHVFQPA